MNKLDTFLYETVEIPRWQQIGLVVMLIANAFHGLTELLKLFT